MGTSFGIASDIHVLEYFSVYDIRIVCVSMKKIHNHNLYVSLLEIATDRWNHMVKIFLNSCMFVYSLWLLSV